MSVCMCVQGKMDKTLGGSKSVATMPNFMRHRRSVLKFSAYNPWAAVNTRPRTHNYYLKWSETPILKVWE